MSISRTEYEFVLVVRKIGWVEDAAHPVLLAEDTTVLRPDSSVGVALTHTHLNTDLEPVSTHAQAVVELRDVRTADANLGART